MTRTRETRILLIPLLAIIALSFGCGSPADDGAIAEPADSTGSGELPVGHPPVDSPPPSAGIVPPPAGSGTGEAGISWSTPEGWVAETPRSAMRRAQYRVAGAGGDAECVVFYFGPGQGGGALANVERWADQFAQPDGGSSRDVMKTEQTEIADMPVLLTEVTGTYSGGMAMMGGPAQQLTGYALLGAVVEGPDANWFFKLTGPEETVFAQRDAFRRMIESIRRGGASQT